MRSLPRWTLVVAAGVVTALLALGVYFASVFYAVWQQARVDEAQPADAIVVLGAAQYYGRPSPILKARLDHALSLYRRHMAPRIIATGGYGKGAEFSESEVARDYLSQQGVPAEFVTVETSGTSTMESAAAVAEIMDRMELRSCIVVSDGYHIYRIKRMLEDQGIRVHGSPRIRGSDDRWARARHYAREALSYILWRIGIRV